MINQPLAKSTSPPPRLLVWGAGALGGRVASRWPGHAIGFTKTDKRHASLHARGVSASTGDPLALLADTDCLLLALPGHAAQHEALLKLRSSVAPARLVVISSTGYFGALPRGNITIGTPPPKEERAQQIAAMETGAYAIAADKTVVMRCGGLYGPDRGPFAALRRRGAFNQEKDPDRTLPLIHLDDAATAILAALIDPTPQPAYIAVVNPSPSRREFYLVAYNKLGWQPPVFPPVQVEVAAVFDDVPLRRDLLPQPAYPDWHSVFDL